MAVELIKFKVGGTYKARKGWEEKARYRGISSNNSYLLKSVSQCEDIPPAAQVEYVSRGVDLLTKLQARKFRKVAFIGGKPAL